MLVYGTLKQVTNENYFATSSKQFISVLYEVFVM